MAKIVDKEAKRLEILKAAVRVFAERGVAATKIQDIAKAAGIAQGTIYIYFKNKEEVFEYILKSHVSAMETIMEDLKDDDTDPRQRLKKIVLGIVRETPRDHAVIVLDILSAMIRNPRYNWAGKSFTGFHSTIVDCLEDGIKSGLFEAVDARTLSSAIIGMIHGLGLMGLMDKNQLSQKEVLEQTLEIILRGIGSPSAV
ncbi:MAG: TetR/AcrR family transcriptional regulator [Proteobacteria bacterium]|nr:TetR/AcrR family transcriptional regulator [Pseudomonadota bacterium]